MMKNRLHILNLAPMAVLTVFVLTGTVSAQPPQGSTSLTMDEYVQEVLRRSPQLATRRADREASQYRVRQAGSLPDPVVGLSVMNLPWGSFSFDKADMTMKTLSVSQGFPAPGVRGARTAVAEAEVGIADRQVALTREALARQAKLVFLDLFYVDRAIQVVTENQALLEQFIRIAETRYRTGTGIQQDVLKAQLEHSRLTEKKITLEAQRASLLSVLNALRDRPAEEEVEVEGLPGPEEVLPDPALLFTMAQAHSPRLLGSRAEIEQRQAALDLARLLRRPNWNAALSYAQRDGGREDFISAMVMVQVPLYAGRKQRRAVDEQAARLDAARYSLRGVELDIEADIHRLLSQLDRSRRLIELYANEILPEAEAVLTSTVAGYRVDEVDFLTLLSAQATLFNYQLESIQAATDYHRHFAGLEAVVGTSLTEARPGE